MSWRARCRPSTCCRARSTLPRAPRPRRSRTRAWPPALSSLPWRRAAPKACGGTWRTRCRCARGLALQAPPAAPPRRSSLGGRRAQARSQHGCSLRPCSCAPGSQSRQQTPSPPCSIGPLLRAQEGPLCLLRRAAAPRPQSNGRPACAAGGGRGPARRRGARARAGRVRAGAAARALPAGGRSRGARGAAGGGRAHDRRRRDCAGAGLLRAGGAVRAPGCAPARPGRAAWGAP